MDSIFNQKIFLLCYVVTHLLTSLHHDGNSGDEISSLLAHLSRFVIHSPQNYTANLGQIWLNAFSQLVHDGTKTV